MKVEIKADESPLTAVDQDSHECILKRLIETGFPIVSEEAKELPFDSPYYWLVDPLDGTKDFIGAT